MKIVLIGAGQRGRVYADYMMEKGCAQIVAIVEPNDVRRKEAAAQLGVAADWCFTAAEELWAQGKIADAAIVASMDRDHYTQVMKALELGYHVLLEKPISPNPAECMDILHRAEEKKLHVVVCHVLRYTPFFSRIKEIIDSGRSDALCRFDWTKTSETFISHTALCAATGAGQILPAPASCRNPAMTWTC